MGVKTLKTKSGGKTEIKGLSKGSTSQHIYDAWFISTTIVLFLLMALVGNQ